MTEQTPPPPGPPTPPPPTEPAAPAEAAATPRTGGIGKKTIVGGIAAALVLGGGYGAYAVYDRLDGGGPQPHDVMPATTQAYARIDLDPSASQKIELFKLIRKFPDLAKEIGIKNEGQDLRELFVDEVIAAECDDIDFEDDIKPWLGERVGVGGNFEDEKFTVAVQVTDEKKARAGFKELFACSDDDYGIAFLDGYAILAPSQKDVDESVEATGKGTLGDKKEFVETFDGLGEQGIVSAWADGKAILEIPEIKSELERSDSTLGDPDKIGSFASALRVDGNALEIASIAGVDDDIFGKGASSSHLTQLPADTVAALSVPGLGDLVGDQFDTLLEESGLGSTASDDFEKETGLDVEEDLKTLLGDELTLAIGGKNLQNIPALSDPGEVTTLDIALALRSDPTKALDLVKRLADLAGEAGIPLTTSQTDDGAVLATNQDFADAIADPKGELGDEAAFTSVIPGGKAELGGLFVNVGAIVDTLREADPPPDVEEVLDQIEPLWAVGFSGSKVGDDTVMSLIRLSLRD